MPLGTPEHLQQHTLPRGLERERALGEPGVEVRARGLVEPLWIWNTTNPGGEVQVELGEAEEHEDAIAFMHRHRQNVEVFEAQPFELRGGLLDVVKALQPVSDEGVEGALQ